MLGEVAWHGRGQSPGGVRKESICGRSPKLTFRVLSRVGEGSKQMISLSLARLNAGHPEEEGERWTGCLRLVDGSYTFKINKPQGPNI